MQQIKYFVVVICAILLPAVFLPTLVGAQSNVNRVVTLAEDETVTKDYYVKAGDVVEIFGTVNGDVVIGGGQLVIDGVINGDLLAAGGTITLSGTVSQDVRIVGGNVNISGNIGRNLTVVGSNIELDEAASVGGGVLVAGGNVFLSGPIEGELKAGAANLVIENRIGRGIEAGVGMLNISSSADITGDVFYYSDTDATVDKSASISGEIQRKEIPVSVIAADKNAAEAARQNFGKLKAFSRFIGLLSVLLFGILMLRFFEKYTNSVSDLIVSKGWTSIGTGLITLLVTPLVAILLLVTVIGIPLGLVLIVAYVLFIYLAKVFFALFIGNKVYALMGRKKTRYLPLVVGLIIFYLASAVPKVGGFVNFTVILAGLGAVVLSCKEYLAKT